MTATTTEVDLMGTIFVAINRALKAEGFSNSEAFRMANRGARLLAAPETPELIAALKAADGLLLPPKIKQAFNRLECSLDKFHAELRRAFWVFSALIVAAGAFLTFLLIIYGVL